MKNRRSIAIILAAIVVFITTYLLILPAFTVDKWMVDEDNNIVFQIDQPDPYDQPDPNNQFDPYNH